MNHHLNCQLQAIQKLKPALNKITALALDINKKYKQVVEITTHEKQVLEQDRILIHKIGNFQKRKNVKLKGLPHNADQDAFTRPIDKFLNFCRQEMQIMLDKNDLDSVIYVEIMII